MYRLSPPCGLISLYAGPPKGRPMTSVLQTATFLHQTSSVNGPGNTGVGQNIVARPLWVLQETRQPVQLRYLLDASHKKSLPIRLDVPQNARSRVVTDLPKSSRRWSYFGPPARNRLSTFACPHSIPRPPGDREYEGEVYPLRITGCGQTPASTTGWLSRALRQPEALGLHLRWIRYSNGSEHGDCSSGTTHPNRYLA